jgi:hypothetical protein
MAVPAEYGGRRCNGQDLARGELSGRQDGVDSRVPCASYLPDRRGFLSWPGASRQGQAHREDRRRIEPHAPVRRAAPVMAALQQIDRAARGDRVDSPARAQAIAQAICRIGERRPLTGRLRARSCAASRRKPNRTPCTSPAAILARGRIGFRTEPLAPVRPQSRPVGRAGAGPVERSGGRVDSRIPRASYLSDRRGRLSWPGATGRTWHTVRSDDGQRTPCTSAIPGHDPLDALAARPRQPVRRGNPLRRSRVRRRSRPGMRCHPKTSLWEPSRASRRVLASGLR